MRDKLLNSDSITNTQHITASNQPTKTKLSEITLSQTYIMRHIPEFQIFRTRNQKLNLQRRRKRTKSHPNAKKENAGVDKKHARTLFLLQKKTHCCTLCVGSAIAAGCLLNLGSAGIWLLVLFARSAIILALCFLLLVVAATAPPR